MKKLILLVTLCIVLIGCKKKNESNFTEYKCFGNEPFWTLVVKKEGMKLISLAQNDTIFYKYEEVENSMEKTSLVGSALIDENEKISVEIKKGQCFDTMKGEEFTHSVRVEANEKILTGCAKLREFPEVSIPYEFQNEVHFSSEWYKDTISLSLNKVVFDDKSFVHLAIKSGDGGTILWKDSLKYENLIFEKPNNIPFRLDSIDIAELKLQSLYKLIHDERFINKEVLPDSLKPKVKNIKGIVSFYEIPEESNKTSYLIYSKEKNGVKKL